MLALGGVVPHADVFAARRVDDACPCGADAGGDGGANENLHHFVKGGVKHADNAFVAGKKVGDVLSEKGINGIKLARDVNHLAQGGGAGHVHAVVVARGKVGGDECAVGKLGG